MSRERQLVTLYPNTLEKSKQLLISYPRPARLFLGALLAIKLAVTLFNATVYDAAWQYDPAVHFPALASCGFYASVHSYNPPLYHWLSCPAVVVAHLAWLPDRLTEFRSTPAGKMVAPFASRAKAFAKFEAQSLQRDLFAFVKSGPVAMARTWNLTFLAAFYALACFLLFPAFLHDWRACLFCSITLLAFPGYQRMAVMVNPENLLDFATIAGFVVLYFAMQPGVSSRTKWLSCFVVIATLALSRPLAIVPAAVFSAYIVLKPVFRDDSTSWRVLRVDARKYVLLFAAIAVVGSAWWVYRVAMLGTNQAFITTQYSHLDRHAARRHAFDYKGFYTTTHFSDLFKTPNRNIAANDPPCVRNGHTCLGRNDSFFTLLLSETYGEHWLFYSGPPKLDEKIVFKRASLAFGVIFTPVLLLLFIAGGWRAIRSRTVGLLSNARMQRLEWIVAALVGVGGFAAYMVWQIKLGLQPGKNSSVKFTYFAFTVPFLLIFIGRGFPKMPMLAKTLIVLAIVGYVVLLPIAVLWA